MEEKVCKKCGYELFPTDKECDRCGTTVAESASTPVQKAGKMGGKSGRNSKAHSADSQAASKAPMPNQGNATVRSNASKTGSRVRNQAINNGNNTDIYGMPVRNQNVEENNENKTLKIVLITLAIVFLTVFVVGIIIFGVYKVNNGDFEESLFSRDDDDYDDDEEEGAKKGLFDVEITIPEEYVYDFEFSQEDFDTMIESGGAKDVIYNDDGSVTVIMSKVQHKVAMGVLKKYIKETINESVEDGFYDGVTKIDFNDDFTEFKVHTDSSEYDLDDDVVKEDMFYQSGLYAVCSGKSVGKISIELIDGSNNSYNSVEYDDSGDFDSDDDIDFSDVTEAEGEMVPIEIVD